MKKIVYIILLNFVFTGLCFSSNTDSLAVYINGLKSSNNKADKFIDLSTEYRKIGEVDKSIEYVKKAINLSKQLNYKDGLAKAYGLFGLIYSGIGSYSNSLEYHFKSLKIYEELKHEEGVSICYSNIGTTYKDQKEYEKGLEYLFKSLEINLKLNRKKGLAATYGNLGIIYSRLNQFQNAIDYFDKSLKICKEINAKSFLANCELNIAGVYFRQFDESTNEADRSNFSKLAIEYFEKALKSNQELNYTPGTCSVLGNLGILYVKKGDLILGEKYLSQSDSIARLIEYTEVLKNNAKAKSELFEKLGNHEKAFQFYRDYEVLKDSLNNSAETKKSLKLELQYNYEKLEAIAQAEVEKNRLITQKKEKDILLLRKDKELKEVTISRNQTLLKQKEIESENQEKKIELLNKDNLIKEFEANQKESELKTQKSLTTLFLIIGIIFLFLSVAAIKGYINKRKSNKLISQQKVEVELAHLELEEKNKEILDSIHYAKRIQSAVLPPDKVVKEYLEESFILYKPKDIVAGDFYWLEHKDNKILFAACDCTGHGVPGAMVSVICNNGLNRSVREHGLTVPGEILNKTREIVIQEFEKSEEDVKDGMDIALCSLEGNTLQYAGANNPLWIIRKGAKEIEEIKADKQPIGKYSEPTPYNTHTIKLQKGDTLYIFSDGFADQFGGDKGKKFKSANFKQLLLSIQYESIERQKQLIDEAFENWKGNLEQLDDVCIIGVRI